jgi:hypothetical protein
LYIDIDSLSNETKEKISRKNIVKYRDADNKTINLIIYTQLPQEESDRFGFFKYVYYKLENKTFSKIGMIMKKSENLYTFSDVNTATLTCYDLTSKTFIPKNNTTCNNSHLDPRLLLSGYKRKELSSIIP